MPHRSLITSITLPLPILEPNAFWDPSAYERDRRCTIRPNNPEQHPLIDTLAPWLT
jgi:hypothetical protein